MHPRVLESLHMGGWYTPPRARAHGLTHLHNLIWSAAIATHVKKYLLSPMPYTCLQVLASSISGSLPPFLIDYHT